MKLFLKSFVVVSLAVFLSVPALAQETTPSIVRPFRIDAKVNGAQIAKPGDYSISIGDLLELEYSFPVVPAAMPKKLTYQVSVADILDTTEPVVRDVVAPGLVGSGTKAFVFRAANPGTTTVTLDIDGNVYEFSIAVEDSNDGSAAGELCQGIFSAIQFKGRVYIFANGVHPSAGYQTRLEKAAIAIWPPQFSLMCEEPSGVSAQVLTPFSVSASFEAPDPVESVNITDKNGQQIIKVVQF